MAPLSASDAPPLDDLIEALQTASNTSAKQRREKVSVTIDKICGHAFQHGLPREALKTVVDIVTRKTLLDQTSVTNLIKNLYPSQKISSEVVVRIVSGLGQGARKPTPATQGALLRWLITVHGILEDPQILQKFYNVFFSHLDMITIRTPLCHLLSIITRRRHVRLFRIQQLLELVGKVGNEPALVGLLRVYKDYYPDIIIGKSSGGRGSMPPQPDPEWRERLSAVLDAAERHEAGLSSQQNGFRVFRKAGREGKVSIVPDVHTSQANELSVTLEEIDSVDDFVARLENIELPNQIISSLQDPLLQKYLILNPDELAMTRMELWLSRYLNDELDLAREHLPASPQFSELLSWLRAQAAFTKTLLPVVDEFLLQYLPVWDGASNLNALLQLMEFLPVQPFEEFHQKYLRPLEEKLPSQEENAFEQFIVFFKNILRRWRVKIGLQEQARHKSSEQLRDAFKELIEYVDVLILTAICSTPPPSPLTSTVLSFYETLTFANYDPESSGVQPFPVIYPPVHVAYHLLFSSSLSSVSRLCAVLASCKTAFENPRADITTQYTPTYTGKFNGQLMDICNLLWRNRGLNSTDSNAAGCLCPESTVAAFQLYLVQVDREYSLPSAFGISHNWLLSALSIAMFRAMEDEAEAAGTALSERQAGPVTQRTLSLLEKRGGLKISWKQYRVDVLRWLDERGLNGIKELMYSTMVNLKENQG